MKQALASIAFATSLVTPAFAKNVEIHCQEPLPLVGMEANSDGIFLHLQRGTEVEMLAINGAAWMPKNAVELHDLEDTGVVTGAIADYMRVDTAYTINDLEEARDALTKQFTSFTLFVSAADEHIKLSLDLSQGSQSFEGSMFDPKTIGDLFEAYPDETVRYINHILDGMQVAKEDYALIASSCALTQKSVAAQILKP